MDLINKIYFPVPFPELIFGINKRQSLPCGYFRASHEQLHRILLKLPVFLLRNQAAADDCLCGDVLIMHPLFSLGGRRNERFFELLVFPHPFRKRNSAYLPSACSVKPP